MGKSSTCLLAIVATVLATLASDASAQTRGTHQAHSSQAIALSQRASDARAESDAPSVTSMAQDYARAMQMRLGSDPICRPGAPVMLADGPHVCQ